MFLMMNNHILSFEIKKNRELEEANIIKDEFFAIIAHDLRSPLIGIIGFLNVVLDRIEDNYIYDLKEYTKSVKNSIKKTIELLENLLIWAKSQMGLNKYEPLLLNVTDFGMGIKKDDLDKIFKTGNECIRLGTNNESGSGFGLILCKEFVEKNKGRIWVESEENNGSTFFISFPEYLNL